MPPKGSRKSTQANTKPFVPPANAIPHPLPPSVEEAYRRKCCQLRHRYNQMEEHNDAARLRLHRLRRQLDKLRVERAFLLEQIAKRTSMNVEDSEGSPSPPPTVRRPSPVFPSSTPRPARDSVVPDDEVSDDRGARGTPRRRRRESEKLNAPQPKEKPLRIKRGHRKPSAIAGGDPDDKPDESARGPGSPVSETSSKRPNGTARASRAGGAPSNAFEFYSAENRADVAADKEDAEEVAAELARRWRDLDDKEREEWGARFEEELGAPRKKKKAKKEAEEDADTEPEGEEAEPEAEVEIEVEGEGEGEGDVEGEAGDEDNDVEMEGDKEDAEKDDDEAEKEEKEGDDDVEMDDAEADEKK